MGKNIWTKLPTFFFFFWVELNVVVVDSLFFGLFFLFLFFIGHEFSFLINLGDCLFFFFGWLFAFFIFFFN